MNPHFTKSEIAAMFKDFLFIIGSDLPKGSIKQAWQRYMELKRQEKWKADMEALVEDGFLELVEIDGEWCYEPTAKGAASSKAEELERISG